MGKPCSVDVKSENENKNKILLMISNPITNTDWINEAITTRKPGFSLEQLFYTNPEIFNLDIESVFKRYWLLAGHVSQIPKDGDYFLYNIANESVIVIRDGGEIRAHYNVCRHRGSRVLLEQTGNAQRLVCPYHGWVYKKDGSLTHCMYYSKDFKKKEYGLDPIHVRTACGLIYISFAEHPVEFDPFVRDLESHLKLYHLDQAKIAYHKSYTLSCNWKILCENFCECYHCGIAHPEYTARLMYAGVAASPSLKGKGDVIEKERSAYYSRNGLCTDLLSSNGGWNTESWYYMARAAFQPGYVSQTKDGGLVAPLLGELKGPDAGSFAFFSRPNGIMEASSDHAALLRFTPISATQSQADAYWLVRQDAVEGKDYDVERVTWLWKTTGEQDWTICVNNQAGVNSSSYRPGPYSEIELSGGVEDFIRWYLKQLRPKDAFLKTNSQSSQVIASAA